MKKLYMQNKNILFSIIVWSSYLLGCYNILIVRDYPWGVGWFILLYVVLYYYNIKKV